MSETTDRGNVATFWAYHYALAELLDQGALPEVAVALLDEAIRDTYARTALAIPGSSVTVRAPRPDAITVCISPFEISDPLLSR